eukprot:CAMPEP_0119143360 /NCGR_PEP_ID=MMETSP1310-20130426/34215_1 /TAXON_ID=464262 /ORGANISM="Genus nov. species nov., Strain RCC2339" /LENGTH=133 /DNA_ID=CAMNT_0007134983 /DNA_START=448 /DNA_END=845 /DNA_ORIENTATION=-
MTTEVSTDFIPLILENAIQCGCIGALVDCSLRGGRPFLRQQSTLLAAALCNHSLIPGKGNAYREEAKALLQPLGSSVVSAFTNLARLPSKESLHRFLTALRLCDDQQVSVATSQCRGYLRAAAFDWTQFVECR